MNVDAASVFKQFPAMKERLDNWFGSVKHEVLQAWECDETSYIVVKTDNTLYFFRLWTMNGNTVLSVDNQHDL